jgi:limonene-1,2-epoxide hydrolase
MPHATISRRGLFAAGGLAGFAAVAPPAAAAADAPSAGEQANLALVEAFLASWPAPDFDPDKVMATYLAPDCSVRVIDSQPFLHGPAAVAAAFKAYAPHGERFKADVLSSYARGPIVVTQRIDTQVTAGKAGPTFPVVGVFLVKDGMIKEWTDYVVA